MFSLNNESAAKTNAMEIIRERDLNDADQFKVRFVTDVMFDPKRWW